MHNMVGQIDVLIYSVIAAIAVVSLACATGVFYLIRWIRRALTKRKAARK
jgi:hypothetical protein